MRDRGSGLVWRSAQAAVGRFPQPWGHTRGVPPVDIRFVLVDDPEGKLRWQEFAIGIYTGESPLHMRSPNHIDNSVITGGDVSDVPATYVEDPFLLEVKKTRIVGYHSNGGAASHSGY